MVRVLVDQLFEGNKHYIEAAGLAEDDKPEGNLVTGSQYLTVDTTKVYLWDETNEQWHEAGASNA